MRTKKGRIIRLGTSRMFLGWAMVLAILLAFLPAVLAQEATPIPDTWIPPEVVKVANGEYFGIGDQVEFTITVSNPSPQDGVTWHNVRMTDILDPALEVVDASSTMGTATIVNDQTVVVNGGITLPPQESFVVTIVATVVGGEGQVVYNDATVEYTDEDDNPQPPIDTDEPVEIIIEEEVPPVIPEASTLILLGSAASGLAGYVGLQVRARRRRDR